VKLVVSSCEVVATMDDGGTEIAGGSILVEDGVITWVGSGAPPDAEGAEVLDGSGSVALPGFINTHHHMQQALTRCRAQDQSLFGWLVDLYPTWALVDEEWMRAAAGVAMAELALSGCTTTMDHHYVFPDGVPNLLEAEIDAAREIGIRFLGTRGSMDLSVKDGGLPPDSVVQDLDTILAHSEEVVGRYHDPAPGSMLQIGIAPCSPFSVTDRLMVESAAQARRLGVRLHTHIAETVDEEEHCLDRFGLRPLELLDDRGWLGPDVWLAHCVQLNDRDIERVAETGTGVAWCPTSNLRVVGGIAPARKLLDHGATVGLGVDGSASNDVGNMTLEARMAMLVPRAVGGTSAMSARDALRVATRGGAGCLGRPELGSLEVGKRADIALFPVDGLAFAGAEADLVAGVLLCPGPRVRHLVVEGRPVVRDSRLVDADEDELAAAARRVTARLSATSGAPA
jgi:cytosine/adenosine deaminase-related metal-dependent hydrolase